MPGLLVVSAVFAGVSSLILWRLVYLFRRHRVLAGLVWSAQGLFWLSGLIAALLLSSNLYTYERLTFEQVVGDVSIERLGVQRYRIRLQLEGQGLNQQTYLLEGDEWQLDVRLLKWQGWANLIGLDSYFQLDRLSSRYQDPGQARTVAPSVHDLRSLTGLDIFNLKQQWQGWLPMVDASFGQGVFMPLEDGARYRVSIGQQGLLVRPVNAAAGKPN
jgi:hypothetical protein